MYQIFKKKKICNFFKYHFMSSPAYAEFFGYIGIASAQIFTIFGAAYGTAKSAGGICSMGVRKPELIMKSIVPIVMAGKRLFLIF